MEPVSLQVQQEPQQLHSHMLFNLQQYKDLLTTISGAGHRFIAFSDIDEPDHGQRRILLRHDIDTDVSAALEMAKVEARLGIKATYFFMLRSPVYNLMGRQNSIMAADILRLGHAIGLHYDQGFDALRGWSHQETQHWINQEAQWLEALLDVPIAAVSFHQPGSAVMQNEINTGSRINTYDKQKLAEYQYFSDSNRDFHLGDVINAEQEDANRLLPNKLQLLIHPMWWVYDERDTEKVWNRVIQSNFTIMQKQLLMTERAFLSARQISIE